MYKILLVIGLLVQVQSFRTHTAVQPRQKTVCKIKEKEGTGDVLYKIKFSLDVGKSCSDITTCNFWKMNELSKEFLEKPLRIPATGKNSKCRCTLKSVAAPGRNLPVLADEDKKTLLEFMTTKQERCSEYKCWRKYNEFLNRAMRRKDQNSDHRNHSANGNHWDIGCSEGEASLAGLKSIRQLHDEASDEQKVVMTETLAEAFILPNTPLPTVTALKKLGTVRSKVSLHSLKGMAQRRITKSLEGNMTEEQAILFRSDRIQKSVALLIDLELKLAKMLADADDFARTVDKMNRGELDDEALEENLNAYRLLEENKAVIVRNLKQNVDILDAFNAATELEDAPPEALDAFMAAARHASVVQRQVIRSLGFLIENGESALRDFEKRDGKQAYAIATHILEQLGQVLKPAVSESKVALEDAMKQFEEVDEFSSVQSAVEASPLAETLSPLRSSSKRP